MNIEMYNIICKSLDNNECFYAMLCDMFKAFDRVLHRGVNIIIISSSSVIKRRNSFSVVKIEEKKV